MKFLAESKIDLDKTRLGYKVMTRIPFNSTRKRMTTVWQVGESSYMMAVKGASEYLVERCTKRLDLASVKSLQKRVKFLGWKIRIEHTSRRLQKRWQTTP